MVKTSSKYSKFHPLRAIPRPRPTAICYTSPSAALIGGDNPRFTQCFPASNGVCPHSKPLKWDPQSMLLKSTAASAPAPLPLLPLPGVLEFGSSRGIPWFPPHSNSKPPKLPVAKATPTPPRIQKISAYNSHYRQRHHPPPSPSRFHPIFSDFNCGSTSFGRYAPSLAFVRPPLATPRPPPPLLPAAVLPALLQTP